jgi:L-aminopeptidase/D-esterase-like protein
MMRGVEKIRITDIRGFRIGQEQNLEAATGCTVIIAEDGAVGAVDVRGGSPGTRDTDALNPINNRRHVHGVLLAGGSSFGLEAAGGVMRFLEERGIGRDLGVAKIPNLCAAILFDLRCGAFDIRPDAAMGYAACLRAFRGEAFQSGNYGAGAGATVGKIRGMGWAMKGGIGAAAFRCGDFEAGALAAVNCVGDVVRDGKVIAGALAEGRGSFAGTEDLMLREYRRQKDFFSGPGDGGDSGAVSGGNTVLGCIITNGKLDKAGAFRVAAQGQNGIARTIRPPHSVFDGDTVFALCSGEVDVTVDAAGILACAAVEAAIIDAVQSARSLGGYPAARDLREG